tara:strand:- start:196 stop:399 length:204 start_codon:yes stop_codon:yes gene_type:complete
MNEVEFYTLCQTLKKDKTFIKPDMLFSLIKDFEFSQNQVNNLRNIFVYSDYEFVFDYLDSIRNLLKM